MRKLCSQSLLMGMFSKKIYSKNDIKASLLSRCLTTLDLTALGVGATLGAGVYVVAGKVAQETAGPAVILSFLIAAIASILAGLCYAEFGAYVPRSGSAYVYSYVSVGELMAFVIGWNMILEYVIGTASVARAWSANVDEISGGHIKAFFLAKMPMNVAWISSYPDFFAFTITIILTGVLCVGIKESTRLNNILTLLNLAVIIYVVTCGFLNAKLENWKLDPNKINATEMGEGFFFPFGLSGVLSGAGTCFYAFVGFDSISTTGEEVLNPAKSLPIAIMTSLGICFLAYASVSAVITLMYPYYLLNPDAPLPFVFEKINWTASKYIVGVGALFGLSTSLLGSLLPLPRVIYAMSNDGLLFKFLSRINERFKTPLIATVISGVFAAIMATLFDLKELVDMMSIGTLLAYTLVAFSILMLRGSKDFISAGDLASEEMKSDHFEEDKITLNSYFLHILKRRTDEPSNISDFISKLHSYIILILVLVVDILLSQHSMLKQPVMIFFITLLCIWIIFLCITLQIQPKNTAKVSFKTPGSPWLPVVSIMINLYLMIELPVDTWYRFVIWMTLGFLIYFCYGLCHSEERKRRIEERQSLLKSEETRYPILF